MKRPPFLSTLALVATLLISASFPPKPLASPGVHFKIAGHPYDIPQIRGIYLKDKGGMFTIYNAGLPGFPETTITLSIGSDFTASTGTFKSAANDKGFIFGFTQGTMKDMTGYTAGKDDPDQGITAANTPVASFSVVGTDYIKGNVTAQGAFSGKVYDFKNKRTVDLTDGTFSVQAGQ
jgi:hypothetical protein